jgi:hypothetical protein
VFKISTNGALTSLYSFTGGNDGAIPMPGWCRAATAISMARLLDDGGVPNGLIEGIDGSFYGTTQTNDAGGGGTVFRLTIVPDPQLTIVPSEANMVLIWPTNYGAFSFDGFTLQTTTNLGPSAVWTSVSSSPVVISGQNVMTNPISGAQQFFRLSQ